MPPNVLARLTVLPVAAFLSENVPELATVRLSLTIWLLKTALVVLTVAAVVPS